ncbi:MAG: S-layer protein, partial [Deinococcus sp.]
PVALGAYYDRQTRYDTVANPDSVIVDRGVAARVSLFSLVGLSGGYYEYLAEAGSLQNTANASNTVTGNGVRYTVRAEITPGLALSVAAYYRHVGDLTTGRGTAQSDGGLFANGKYNSYFPTGSSVFTNQTGCGDQHPGLSTRDTDGVGGALSFSQRSFLDTTCYTEYGVEVAHDGKSDAAIVKNLNLRLGYANRYRDATASYSNSFLYGDAVYSAKLGIANINFSGAFGQNRYSAAELNGDFTDAAGAGLTPTPPANRTSAAVGLKVTTDTLPIIFKPSLEGQVGYYTSAYTYGTGVGAPENYTANGLKYVAGVKLNELLLPNTNLAVYYSGYRATNRQYTPVTADLATSAGFFSDTNNGAVTTLNGLYFEANYYDLNFAYGVYNLSQNVGGTETAAVNAAGEAVPARGQTFKIRYNVNF